MADEAKISIGADTRDASKAQREINDGWSEMAEQLGRVASGGQIAGEKLTDALRSFAELLKGSGVEIKDVLASFREWERMLGRIEQRNDRLRQQQERAARATPGFAGAFAAQVGGALPGLPFVGMGFGAAHAGWQTYQRGQGAYVPPGAPSAGGSAGGAAAGAAAGAAVGAPLGPGGMVVGTALGTGIGYLVANLISSGLGKASELYQQAGQYQQSVLAARAATGMGAAPFADPHRNVFSGMGYSMQDVTERLAGEGRATYGVGAGRIADMLARERVLGTPVEEQAAATQAMLPQGMGARGSAGMRGAAYDRLLSDAVKTGFERALPQYASVIAGAFGSSMAGVTVRLDQAAAMQLEFSRMTSDLAQRAGWGLGEAATLTAQGAGAGERMFRSFSSGGGDPYTQAMTFRAMGGKGGAEGYNEFLDRLDVIRHGSPAERTQALAPVFRSMFGGLKGRGAAGELAGRTMMTRFQSEYGIDLSQWAGGGPESAMWRQLVQSGGEMPEGGFAGFAAGGNVGRGIAAPPRGDALIVAARNMVNESGSIVRTSAETFDRTLLASTGVVTKFGNALQELTGKLADYTHRIEGYFSQSSAPLGGVPPPAGTDEPVSSAGAMFSR